MKTFPLPADSHYDYADRYGEAPGDHHGTDIFASEGVPVLAVIDGAAHPTTDPKGGIVVYVANEDGSEVYYYAHLRDTDPIGTADYTIVKAGDPIGHVGVSGNAAGTPPHLHLQARWNGRLADPYSMLREVDTHSVPGGGTSPHAPRPSTDWGGPSFPDLEKHAWIWGAAIVLGCYLAYKTLFPRRSHDG